MDSFFNYPDLRILLEVDITDWVATEPPGDMSTSSSQGHVLLITQPATSTQTSGEKESENPTSLEIEAVSSAKDGEEIIAVVANNETFDLDIENVFKCRGRGRGRDKRECIQ